MSASYVVHSASGALRATVPAVIAAAALVVAGGVLQGHWTFVGIAMVAVLALAVTSARAGWPLLQVDAQGIALSYRGYRNRYGLAGAEQRRTEWRFVRQVLVGPGRRVQVVLRQDAPLPGWMTGRITDPNDPEGGVRYACEVPGLDATALERAVRELAPHVEVRTLTS